MANANTISIMSTKPRELNQGGTSTSEVLVTSDGTAVVYAPLPTAQQLGGTTATDPGCAFRVRARGRANSTAAGNITVKLYSGTSNTIASNNAIATTGAVSITGKTNWLIEATLVWDGQSKKVNGWYAAQLGATATANTTITNVLSSIDPTTSAAQGFNVTGQFGTGVATNTLYVDEISIEIL